MFKFNLPASGPSQGRTAQLQAASDLVNKTLAQHGLSGHMPQSIQPATDAGDTRHGQREQFTCAHGAREYLLHVPSAPVQGVLLMLHGCTQTPEDFAAGTNMNAVAEAHGLVVIYPHQSRGANAQSCWNWFSRGDQRHGKGEPAILAELTRTICDRHGIGRDRTFVAGLSAGAAMAVILGEVYDDVFSAIGAHSGLPFGAANDVPSAFAAMAGQAAEALPRAGSGQPMRTMILHGSTDSTVHPANGTAIADRATRALGRDTLETSHDEVIDGRSCKRTVRKALDGPGEVEELTVQGLGHAWSGGSSSGSYTDPKGPDASAEFVRFFMG